MLKSEIYELMEASDDERKLNTKDLLELRIFLGRLAQNSMERDESEKQYSDTLAIMAAVIMGRSQRIN